MELGNEVTNTRLLPSWEKFQLLSLIGIDTFLDIYPSDFQGISPKNQGLTEFLVHLHGISHIASKQDTWG